MTGNITTSITMTSNITTSITMTGNITTRITMTSNITSSLTITSNITETNNIVISDITASRITEKVSVCLETSTPHFLKLFWETFPLR